MTLLTQLEELAGKATPGSWDIAPYYIGTGPDEVCRGMLVNDGDWPIGIISENDPPLDDTLSHDLSLIVALRNNLPTILSALKAVEWQPIETAPKDGTEIVLRLGETIPDHSYVCTGTFIGEEEGEKLGYWQGWLVWSQDGCDFDVLFEDAPLFWRPLGPVPENEHGR